MFEGLVHDYKDMSFGMRRVDILDACGNKMVHPAGADVGYSLMDEPIDEWRQLMTEYYLNLEWKAGKADSEYREQLRKAVTAEESAVYRCARWAASEQEAFTGSVLWLLSDVGKQQVSLLGRA